MSHRDGLIWPSGMHGVRADNLNAYVVRCCGCNAQPKKCTSYEVAFNDSVQFHTECCVGKHSVEVSIRDIEDGKKLYLGWQGCWEVK